MWESRGRDSDLLDCWQACIRPPGGSCAMILSVMKLSRNLGALRTLNCTKICYIIVQSWLYLKLNRASWVNGKILGIGAGLWVSSRGDVELCYFAIKIHSFERQESHPEKSSSGLSMPNLMSQQFQPKNKTECSPFFFDHSSKVDSENRMRCDLVVESLVSTPLGN